MLFAQRATARFRLCASRTFSIQVFQAPLSSRSISRANAPSSLARICLRCAAAATQPLKAPESVLFSHRVTATWDFLASSTFSVQVFHAALSSRSISLAKAPSSFSRWSLRCGATSAHRWRAAIKALFTHLVMARWLLWASRTFSSHWFHAPLNSLSMSRDRAPSTLTRISAR